jgi:hypothetical protein
MQVFLCGNTLMLLCVCVCVCVCVYVVYLCVRWVGTFDMQSLVIRDNRVTDSVFKELFTPRLVTEDEVAESAHLSSRRVDNAAEAAQTAAAADTQTMKVQYTRQNNGYQQWDVKIDHSYTILLRDPILESWNFVWPFIQGVCMSERLCANVRKCVGG